MSAEESEARLSRLATLWTVVCDANRAAGTVQESAQRRMLEYYGSAIKRYLRGALKNEDAADEVFQEFAVRFLHGDLRGADPERGRFRDYVKRVLFHLIADHCRKQKRQPCSMPEGVPEPASEADLRDSEKQFLEAWRDELLARAWSALEEHQQQSGQPYHAVLRYRAEHPDLSSTALAEQLSGSLGRPLTAPGVRQILHRARDRFADLLLERVEQSLKVPSPGVLEQELADLGLLGYCRPALDRQRKTVAE